MKITICNQEFDTNEINSLEIADGRIFIETADDFFNLRWTNEEQICEARAYLRFQTLTRTELIKAVDTIMIVCSYFINEKEQCAPCPLKKREGCIFKYVPIEWRE